MFLIRSLRFRLLAPLVLVGLVAAGVVAWLASANANRAVRDRLDARASQLTEVLRSPNYPLTRTVLDTLAELTDCQLATTDQYGDIIDTTLRAVDVAPVNGELVIVEDATYHCRIVDLVRPDLSSNGATRLVLLVDTDQLDAERRRAATLPIVTGTVVLGLLSGVWLISSTRVVGRIRRLQERFRQISDGEFDSPESWDGKPTFIDEIGQLSNSAETMAGRLKQLWNQVSRQQGERIIHQVASGMAHQLRNSLTGARIAIELEEKERSTESSENLSVALSQLEQSETHVQQLLMLASGKLVGIAPTRIHECVDTLRQTFRPIAKHRKKSLNWTIDQIPDDAIALRAVRG